MKPRSKVLFKGNKQNESIDTRQKPMLAKSKNKELRNSIFQKKNHHNDNY